MRVLSSLFGSDSSSTTPADAAKASSASSSSSAAKASSALSEVKSASSIQIPRHEDPTNPLVRFKYRILDQRKKLKQAEDSFRQAVAALKATSKAPSSPLSKYRGIAKSSADVSAATEDDSYLNLEMPNQTFQRLTDTAIDEMMSHYKNWAGLRKSSSDSLEAMQVAMHLCVSLQTMINRVHILIDEDRRCSRVVDAAAAHIALGSTSSADQFLDRTTYDIIHKNARDAEMLVAEVWEELRRRFPDAINSIDPPQNKRENKSAPETDIANPLTAFKQRLQQREELFEKAITALMKDIGRLRADAPWAVPSFARYRSPRVDEKQDKDPTPSEQVAKQTATTTTADDKDDKKDNLARRVLAFLLPELPSTALQELIDTTIQEMEPLDKRWQELRKSTATPIDAKEVMVLLSSGFAVMCNRICMLVDKGRRWDSVSEALEKIAISEVSRGAINPNDLGSGAELSDCMTYDSLGTDPGRVEEILVKYWEQFRLHSPDLINSMDPEKQRGAENQSAAAATSPPVVPSRAPITITPARVATPSSRTATSTANPPPLSRPGLFNTLPGSVPGLALPLRTSAPSTPTAASSASSVKLPGNA